MHKIVFLVDKCQWNKNYQNMAFYTKQSYLYFIFLLADASMQYNNKPLLT